MFKKNQQTNLISSVSSFSYYKNYFILQGGIIGRYTQGSRVVGTELTLPLLHCPLSIPCAAFSSFHLPASQSLGWQSISKATGRGTNLHGKEGDVPRWGERVGMTGQAVLVPCGKGTEGRKSLVAVSGGCVVGPLQAFGFWSISHIDENRHRSSKAELDPFFFLAVVVMRLLYLLK